MSIFMCLIKDRLFLSLLNLNIAINSSYFHYIYCKLTNLDFYFHQDKKIDKGGKSALSLVDFKNIVI